MLTWFSGLAIGLLAVGVYFFRSNRKAAERHARFQSKDVEEALAEVLSPDARSHDAFDLFLAWPIDDPHLESIRQQCHRIIAETDPSPPGQDLSDAGLRRIAALLDELRSGKDSTTR